MPVNFPESVAVPVICQTEDQRQTNLPSLVILGIAKKWMNISTKKQSPTFNQLKYFLT
jgi:hypothetical protein